MWIFSVTQNIAIVQAYALCSCNATFVEIAKNCSIVMRRNAKSFSGKPFTVFLPTFVEVVDIRFAKERSQHL
jgi:hypothetical protein